VRLAQLAHQEQPVQQAAQDLQVRQVLPAQLDPIVLQTDLAQRMRPEQLFKVGHSPLQVLHQ
jgi:hypothetical protein